ncbi:hypothetical protein MMC09_001314 [Bachmanniomyces sp. S44760]|nr:hypothetical protein [Bachmanniomyces sp. S44760]
MVSRSGQTLFRLASSNPASLSRYRVERLPFIFQRVLAPYSTQQTSSPLSSVAQNKSRLSIAHRSYATTTEKPVSRPKAHTGRTTSKPRKTTSKGTQTKITGEVKKATKPKTTEPKAKPKARKATKAAKPKRKATRTPRTRTPEQVEDAKNGKAVERYKNQIKKLKEKALKPPHGLPSTAFIVISSELSKNVKGIAGKDASARYKTLSAEELESYNHIANQNKLTNQSEYRKWIESHTPEQIHQANLARRNLTRRKIKGYGYKLQDDRLVKRPQNSYISFAADRYASGDMHGIKLVEASKLIGAEWKGLSAAEKQQYQRAQTVNQEKYLHEYKATYGRELKPKAKAASAA